MYFNSVRLPASTLFDASIEMTALIDTIRDFLMFRLLSSFLSSYAMPIFLIFILCIRPHSKQHSCLSYREAHSYVVHLMLLNVSITSSVDPKPTTKMTTILLLDSVYPRISDRWEKKFPVDPRDFVYRSVDDAKSETEVELCYPNIAPTDVPVRQRISVLGLGFESAVRFGFEAKF